MRVNSTPATKAGFTLIELLLGTMISAMLLASLYEIFRGVLFIQSMSYEALEETMPRSRAAGIIRNDLENMALPNSLLCDSIVGESDGEGDEQADTLRFSTTSGKLSRNAPWGDVQRVEYYLMPPDEPTTDAGQQLVRVATRNLLATTVMDFPEPVPLIDNVSSLEVQYFDGEVWSDSWDSSASESTPRAVHLRVHFAEREKDVRPVPPLEVYCEIASENPSTMRVRASETTSGG